MILQGRDGQIQCDVLGGVEKAQVQHEGGTLQERGLHVTVVVQVGVVPGELQQGEKKLPLVDQGKNQLEEGHMLAGTKIRNHFLDVVAVTAVVVVGGAVIVVVDPLF